MRTREIVKWIHKIRRNSKDWPNCHLFLILIKYNLFYISKV